MNVLFVTSTRIGDAVLSTGLLDHVIRTRPGARITVACGPAAAGLFGAVPGLERVIAMPKRKYGLHWFDLWRQVVPTAWSLVVDLRGSAIAYVLLAGERRVYRTPNTPQHRVRQLSDLFRLATPAAPRLWTAPIHDEAAAKLIPAGGPVLALGPTANWRGKQWRAGHFVGLVERLTGPGGILPGARVAVFGGPGEREAAQPVLDAIPDARRIDLVGTVDLLTAYAALRRCALYVGNDSGLMHMAAAAGIPTLGLFGPSRDEHYAPWGEKAAVVRTAIPYDKLFPPGYDHRTTDTQMDSLSVESAAAAAESLWRRCKGSE
ncbi:MAG TPA: glycosyltransferase family 9 protein [Alphaproteobacteria bacterium]